MTFLGYIVTKGGIQIDLAKVEAITNWEILKNIHEVRSFHGLASFYRRFVQDFSIIIAPLTDCLEGSKFVWTKETKAAFQLLKKKVAEAPILVLPDFNEIFKVQ